MNEVMLCYDGSEDSATAMATAGKLLRPGPAIVAHSWIGVSRLIMRGNAYGTVLDEAVRELDATDKEEALKLARRGAELARQAGFEARPLAIHESKSAWRALRAAAEKHAASVMVVGAHGGSRMAKVLLGSVSDPLVQHAPAPVLVVPSEPQAGEGPLLLCYDGSDDAKHAIGAASGLFAERPAVVLNIWEEWARIAPRYVPLIGGSVAGMAAELDQTAAEQSGEVAAEGARLASEAGFEARPESLCAGDPEWHAILRAADDADAAAIVVGSRGLTGLAAALGSVSAGVLHHARRPVLVVPPSVAGGHPAG